MAAKMSAWTIAAILCVGAGAMMWYSQYDDAKRLSQGEFRRIEYEVIGTHSAAGRKVGSRVDVQYVDPGTGATQTANVPVGPADVAQGDFPTGKRAIGWIHPGFSGPFLTEAKPDMTYQGQFERRAGTVLIVVGAVLLAFAIKTGRLLG